MASLEPVYQKVDTKDPESAPEEIELEDLSRKDTPSDAPKDNCKDKCKKARGKRARRCVRCLSVGFCLFMLASIFVSTIVIGVVAHRVRTCVYPPVNTIKSYTYEPANIDALSFDIPTGSVSVHSCERATNVSVKVTVGAKTTQLLQDIVVHVTESQKTLSIAAQAASFDLLHCQIVHVEVVVPATSTHAISLSASAGTGLIRVDAKSYTFSNVDLKVNVGGIKLRHLDADTLTASASLGGIAARSVKVQQALTVHADVGAMCIHHVDASKTTLDVGKGYLRVRDLDASSISTKVGYGLLTLNEFVSPFTYAELSYGKLWVAPKKDFSGEVAFNTASGRFEVSSHRNTKTPPVNVISPKHQTLSVADSNGKTGVSKINLNTTSGNADLFLGRCSE